VFPNRLFGGTARYGTAVLDPWRLRLLNELESLGTVRAVAGSVRLSPSTVSQQLAVLEREAGTALFERAGRRLRMTPAGTALARHARTILDQIETAQAELLSLDGVPSGRVRVGAFTSAVNTFVIAAVQRLRLDFPRLRVDVHELDPLASLPALRRGDCDVAVTADFVDGSMPLDADVTHVPLIEDRIVLVTMRSPVPVVGAADLTDFRDHRWSAERPGSWTYELITRACRGSGFEPDVAGLFASYGPLLAHVEAGLSVTLLPELAVDPRYRLTTLPLRNPMRRRITAAVRAGSTNRPAVRAVLAALERAARRPFEAEKNTRSTDRH